MRHYNRNGVRVTPNSYLSVLKYVFILSSIAREIFFTFPTNSSKCEQNTKMYIPKTFIEQLFLNYLHHYFIIENEPLHEFHNYRSFLNKSPRFNTDIKITGKKQITSFWTLQPIIHHFFPVSVISFEVTFSR